MSKHLFAQLKAASVRALLAGEGAIYLFGMTFMIEHQHHGEYAVMAPTGEIFRLVKQAYEVEVFT